jgi:uncharacterized membrane protein
MDSTAVNYFILGLVFVAIGAPLIQRRIPRNRWYGFRVAKTFSSERVWYDANQVAGRDLVVAGVVVSVTALVTAGLARRVPELPVAAINLVVFVVVMAAATWHSFAALRRM